MERGADYEGVEPVYQQYPQLLRYVSSYSIEICIDMSEDDETEAVEKKVKAEVKLETDELGLPILPNFAETGRPSLEEAKALIRAFVTAHYSKPTRCSLKIPN
jgi:hypothetical protein